MLENNVTVYSCAADTLVDACNFILLLNEHEIALNSIVMVKDNGIFIVEISIADHFSICNGNNEKFLHTINNIQDGSVIYETLQRYPASENSHFNYTGILLL
jgi:hypothetical protein